MKLHVLFICVLTMFLPACSSTKSSVGKTEIRRATLASEYTPPDLPRKWLAILNQDSVPYKVTLPDHPEKIFILLPNGLCDTNVYTESDFVVVEGISQNGKRFSCTEYFTDGKAKVIITKTSKAPKTKPQLTASQLALL